METQFCGYTLVGEISRGASSVVYRARDRRGSLVALKTLAGHLLGDQTARATFLIEPQKQPRGPHIVRVIDSGECNGVPYMAMELIDGPSLNDLIVQANRTGNPIALSDIDQFLGDIAQALDAAHKSNVIHRDIKPSNILIRASDGQAFLMDFGIAQSRLSVNPGATVARVSVGTSNYVAPEQITDGSVGPSADIYSLGVTIYQALAGRLPFTAEDEIVQMHQHLNEPPPVLRTVSARVPQAVSDVVMRALEKDPKRRYATASEFARSFHRAIAAIPGAARPSLGWPVIAILGGVGVLAIALLVIALSIVAPAASPQTPSAPLPAPSATITRLTPSPSTQPTDEIAATETTAEQSDATSNPTDSPPVATSTLAPFVEDTTATPTPTPTLVGNGGVRYTLPLASLGSERWGRPTSADGCSSFDDQSPVTRYEVMLTILNTSKSPLANWRVDLFNAHGGAFHKCTVSGQEGAEIASGNSYDYKVAAYSEGDLLSRVEFQVDGTASKLCVNGKTLTPCR
jgi:eukaryotic-like serine/threonine-protein kinase